MVHSWKHKFIFEKDAWYTETVLLVAAWSWNFYWGVCFSVPGLFWHWWNHKPIQEEANIRQGTGCVLYNIQRKNKRTFLLVFLGFCSSVVEISVLLGCDTTSLGNWFLITSQSIRNQLLSDTVAHSRRKVTSNFLLLIWKNFFIFMCGCVCVYTHAHL
jgi:hypothetical protein